jgi:hypothetical protein
MVKFFYPQFELKVNRLQACGLYRFPETADVGFKVTEPLGGNRIPADDFKETVFEQIPAGFETRRSVDQRFKRHGRQGLVAVDPR